MASPLVGYNTNVRHTGKVFHIQTEDSGLAHGHIFTHLFADGGRIVATKKTTYAQHIGTDRYPTVVKKLMQAQHKAMFIALRDGLFDEDEVKGAKEFSAREITLDDERGDAKGAPSSPGVIAAPTGASSPPIAAAGPAASAPVLASATDLDIDALERAAAGYVEPTAADLLADKHPTLPGSHAAPLPPIAAVAPTSPAAAKTFSKPGAVALPPPSGPVQAPPPATPGARGLGKYSTTQQAMKKPVSARPRESLFGQDLLSEKSLDEVIMSYLADDLDSKE